MTSSPSEACILQNHPNPGQITNLFSPSLSFQALSIYNLSEIPRTCSVIETYTNTQIVLVGVLCPLLLKALRPHNFIVNVLVGVLLTLCLQVLGSPLRAWNSTTWTGTSHNFVVKELESSFLLIYFNQKIPCTVDNKRWEIFWSGHRLKLVENSTASTAR